MWRCWAVWQEHACTLKTEEQIPPKRQYVYTGVHGVESQKTSLKKQLVEDRSKIFVNLLFMTTFTIDWYMTAKRRKKKT